MQPISLPHPRIGRLFALTAVLFALAFGCGSDDEDGAEGAPVAGHGGSGGRSGGDGDGDGDGDGEAGTGGGGMGGAAPGDGDAAVDSGDEIVRSDDLCPEGVAADDYIVIRTRAELAAFAECREVDTVEIRGMVDYRIDADIVLPKLEKAESLIVTFTLTTKVSAPLLVSASISISDNPELETIELPLLESGRSVDIDENLALTALDLSSLRTTGGFSLRKNPRLEVLSLPSLEEITDEAWADIQIGKARVLDSQEELAAAEPLALTRIELPSLKSIADNFSLGIVENLEEIDAPLLESMDALTANNGVPPMLSFPALKTLGALDVWGDEDLVSISFPALEQIGAIEVRINPKLESIEMPSLETFGGGIFAVTGNSMLSTCALNDLADQVGGAEASPYFSGNLEDCP